MIILFTNNDNFILTSLLVIFFHLLNSFFVMSTMLMFYMWQITMITSILHFPFICTTFSVQFQFLSIRFTMSNWSWLDNMIYLSNRLFSCVSKQRHRMSICNRGFALVYHELDREFDTWRNTLRDTKSAYSRPSQIYRQSTLPDL